MNKILNEINQKGYVAKDYSFEAREAARAKYSQKTTIQSVKEKITSVLEGQFLKEIHYEGNSLAVVKKLGGIDVNTIRHLEQEGFNLRYMNPVNVEGRLGLMISLEVA